MRRLLLHMKLLSMMDKKLGADHVCRSAFWPIMAISGLSPTRLIKFSDQLKHQEAFPGHIRGSSCHFAQNRSKHHAGTPGTHLEEDRPTEGHRVASWDPLAHPAVGDFRWTTRPPCRADLMLRRRGGCVLKAGGVWRRLETFTECSS